VAFGRGDVGLQIVKMLLESGAKTDATDSKQNTTLHYAAGYALPADIGACRHAAAFCLLTAWRVRCRYGRADMAALLLDAGASVAARNDTGKTPLELVKANAQNPVNADEAVLKRLRGGAHFEDV